MEKKEIITAKEIADDVQQTFDGISNSYRKLLEDRINKLVKECNDTLLLRAYMIGWSDALAGDDVSSVDKQSDKQILKKKKKKI